MSTRCPPRASPPPRGAGEGGSYSVNVGIYAGRRGAVTANEGEVRTRRSLKAPEERKVKPVEGVRPVHV